MKPTKWTQAGESPETHWASIDKGEKEWTAKASNSNGFWLLEVTLEPWKNIHWEHTTSLQQAKRRGNAILRALAGDAK